MSFRRVVFVAVLLATAVSGPPRGDTGAGLNQRRSPYPPPTEQEQALREQFEGSYPERAPRSTGIREFTIVAEPSEVEIAEGRRLEVWAYNRQVPGPTLRVRLGQTLRVKFTNRLPQPTTIHWHGVRVPNAMDGVPDVTQPPVLPGEGFVYEFTPKDAGTYWFHPHVRSSEQVERGLFGVLIVEDVEPPPYSRDVMWVLDDWRMTRDWQIDPNFVTRSDLAHDGRWGNVIAVNGHLHEVLTVKPGERIRLRMLNSANGRVFVPDFSGLDAQVIAADGKYVRQPFPPGRFEMAPGNRLDLDITFHREQAGTSFIVMDRFRRGRPLNVAEIRVLDDVVETPEFPSPARAFVPGWQGTAEIQPRLEYLLAAEKGGKYGIQWTLNGLAYPHHRRDLLYRGEWAKIRFTNTSARLHPMHIHGQFFKVLSRNGKPVDEPFWRDTVLTHPRETIDIGMVPLDPGAWMLHCHILEHAAAGMMTLVEVAERPRPAPEPRTSE